MLENRLFDHGVEEKLVYAKEEKIRGLKEERKTLLFLFLLFSSLVCRFFFNMKKIVIEMPVWSEIFLNKVFGKTLLFFFFCCPRSRQKIEKQKRRSKANALF